MRKLAVIAIIVLMVIVYYSNRSFYAQSQEDFSVNQRIQMIENNLKTQHKLYKVIGENRVSPNGKVVHKITSSNDFEILALPMIEPDQRTTYDKEFVGKLFSPDGFKLSEVKSELGIRVVTRNPNEETDVKKTHKFEFINPNETPVKVRFYFVQDAE